jgi:hypothetical protein
MNLAAGTFDDAMAAVYHLIFDNCEAAIEGQKIILSQLLPGLRMRNGYANAGTGAAPATGSRPLIFQGAAIELSQIEAVARNLTVSFRVDDMRWRRTAPVAACGIVLVFDNALPHLDSDQDVRLSACHRDRLRPGGILLISLRDYRPLMEQPAARSQQPCFRTQGGVASLIRCGIGRTSVATSFIFSSHLTTRMLHRPFCRLIPGHDTDEVAIHAECWICRAPDFAASSDKLLPAIIVSRRRAPIFPECGRLKERVGKLNRRLVVLASFN